MRKSKTIWAIGTISALCICFLLCRYLMFELHGMKEWPLDLMMFGAIIIIIAALFNSRKVMCCTIVGYMGGFVLGALLNSNGVDQGGGASNNFWIIWTVTFVVIVFMGIMWELLNKHLKRVERTN